MAKKRKKKKSPIVVRPDGVIEVHASLDDIRKVFDKIKEQQKAYFDETPDDIKRALGIIP